MNPADDPQPRCNKLEVNRDRDVALVLVGHLPHPARLAGWLPTRDPIKTPIQFVNAAVLKIGSAPAGWAVDWYLTPSCVK